MFSDQGWMVGSKAAIECKRQPFLEWLSQGSSASNNSSHRRESGNKTVIIEQKHSFKIDFVNRNPTTAAISLNVQILREPRIALTKHLQVEEGSQ
jgi:hypothetical protein